MFNLPQNNQQLIPMGMQQQPIANMPIQNAQTYYPSVKNLSYGNDTFVNVGAPQKDIAKGFWDGFKTVFSKIGEFCSDNFALILTGVGLFGGCKFCSSSMKTYEENKKNNKLDEKGNLQDKDASLKDKAMNFVGHGVHYVFGSNQVENVDEESVEIEKDEIEDIKQTNEDKAQKELLTSLILNGQISSLLTTFKDDDKIRINILEVISQAININKLPKSTCWDKRQSTIINTLKDLINSDDNDIQKRAINVANALRGTNYFNTKQKTTLEEIVKPKTEESKDEKKED